MYNPRLLFLDEPTSGLDPSGTVLFRRIIGLYLQRQNHGTGHAQTLKGTQQQPLRCDCISASGTSELEAGIPFAHDEIISIHSQEPTLEDMFIQYTGRGLS